jgi:uncharacterized protein
MKIVEFNAHRWGHVHRLPEKPFGSVEFPPRTESRDGNDGIILPRDVRPARRSVGAWLLLAFLRFYIVFLSPVFGGACKFYPSCSNYAVEAVTKHGARRGFVLAAKRLLRCRPFTRGGFDPVPDDLPHSKPPKKAEKNLRVVTEIDSRIQRTERRIL